MGGCWRTRSDGAIDQAGRRRRRRGCSSVQKRKAPTGGYEGVQGSQAACEPRDTMGVLKLKYYTFRTGVCFEILACAMDPMQVFPARGGGRTPRRPQVELPRLARPKGCYAVYDIWS